MIAYNIFKKSMIIYNNLTNNLTNNINKIYDNLTNDY